jgi:hypothetical protein
MSRKSCEGEPVTAILRAAGIYVVRPGYRAVRDALLRTGPRDAVRESLTTLVLVEIEVTRAPGRPNLAEWHQEGLDHVPWDEVYTTLDRSTVIARKYDFDAPLGSDFAMSFFLHFFDPSKRLETPWGSLVLSAAHEQRPDHLRDRVYSDPGS